MASFLKRAPAALRRGAAALEFALTLPVLIVVLGAVIELSLYISHFHQIQRASRDGARVGSITLEGADADGSLITSEAVDHATEVLESVGMPCDSKCNIEAEWLEFGDWMFVEVRVTYPYQSFTSIIPSLSEDTTATFRMLTQQQ